MVKTLAEKGLRATFMPKPFLKKLAMAALSYFIMEQKRSKYFFK